MPYQAPINTKVAVSHRLQLAVDALCDWAETWQLSVSVNKCWVFTVGKAAHITNICINGSILHVVESARDYL